MTEMSKARAILISNLAWAKKEKIKERSRRLPIHRNLAIKKQMINMNRISKRSLKIKHKPKRHGNVEREMSTEVLEAELEAEANQNQEEGNTTLGERWKTLFSSGAPRETISDDANNVTIDASIALERTSNTRRTEFERSRIYNNSQSENEIPGKLTAILEDIEDDNGPSDPSPSTNNNNENLQPENSNNNFPSFESISLEKTNSDGDNSNEQFVLDSALDPKDYVSLSPNEKDLRSDGLLPDLRQFKTATLYFNSFMNEIAKCLEAAQQPSYDLNRMSDV